MRIPTGIRPGAPRNRRLRTDRPPQRQCKDREDHPEHLHEWKGLMWSCQGRGRRVHGS